MSLSVGPGYAPLMPVLWTLSDEMLGHHAKSLGTTAWTGTAWGTANLAIFIPLRLPAPFSCVKACWTNGATVSGNVDVGIYAPDGTRLASTGTTVQASTGNLQAATLTTTIPAGLWYVGLASSSATATFHAFATVGVKGAAVGLAQMGTAFVLPTTATFAQFAQAFVPLVGLSSRTTLE